MLNFVVHAGLPLLYVSGLTVLLGFVRTKNYREYHPYDYGYKQAYVISLDKNNYGFHTCRKCVG